MHPTGGVRTLTVAARSGQSAMPVEVRRSRSAETLKGSDTSLEYKEAVRAREAWWAKKKVWVPRYFNLPW